MGKTVVNYWREEGRSEAFVFWELRLLNVSSQEKALLYAESDSISSPGRRQAGDPETLEMIMSSFSVEQDEECLNKIGQMHSLNSTRFSEKNKKNTILF